MDVFATSVWMGGATIPTDRVIDGKNIASYLGYENVAPKPETPYFYFGIDHQLMAVRKGQWKLHVKTYSQLGLDYFNINADPSEKYNLATKYPEVVKELTSLIEEKLEEVNTTGDFFSKN